MPESFAVGENGDWVSWISHFEDCAILNGWNNERKAQFLAVRVRGAALLQLQSLSSVVRGNYDDFKKHFARNSSLRWLSSYTRPSFEQGVVSGTKSSLT